MTVTEWLGKDNQLGIDIWGNKYRFEEETFDEWLDRVSGGNQNIRKLIEEKKFIFGGRILSNRGLTDRKTTLSNCYVIAPPEDNIESIFDCATKLARTYSYGGGCGIDISKLAPKGAIINNAAKETSGAVSFMELYNIVTGLIGQGGRRGALMISIDCNHPDLEQFIAVKSDLNKITNANISIRMTNEFMEAVKERRPYTLQYVRETTGQLIEREVDAYELFETIAKYNWSYGEPGILFWDRIKNWNLLSTNDEFHYAGVNPCAEEPLPAGGSCLLGSINLAEFVSSNKTFDFTSFIDAVNTSVVGLNDVLDEGLPLHPLKEQRESVSDWRQIGIGIMGLADMLIKMEITYGSDESIKLCNEIGKTMTDQALRSSALLARYSGTYPKYSDEVLDTKFLQDNASQETIKLIKENGLHNSQLLTIAPTGTISTMLGISGGIEPIFANSYTRTTKSLHGKDVEYKVYTPIVESYMKNHKMTEETQLPEWFVTSSDINYKNRINMQSVWQFHIDASISSTANLKHDTTVEEVSNLYLYAYEKGLKGITIFRDGCARTGILITDGSNLETPKISRGDILNVNDDVIGRKRSLVTGCGNLHCEAFFDPVSGELLETYLSKGSTGGCANFMVGLSRMISLAVRGGLDIYSIVDQLNSCGVCPSYAVRKATKGDTSKGSCCPIAVGNALMNMYDEIQDELGYTEDEEETAIFPKDNLHVCPECGEDEVIFEGGCNICKACGWSKCG